MNKSALILGATGLVGRHCLDILLNDAHYSIITIIVRKAIDINHIKLKQVICPDFAHLNQFVAEFKVDEVFCCIGTTIHTAGSKAAFTAVDFEIPDLAAKLSSKQGVGLFSVVSAIGANVQSRNFYLRTKGSMEKRMYMAGIKRVHIFRPSLIIGARAERRTGEKIAQLLMPIVDVLLLGKLRKYKSISAKDIAQSMVNAANNSENGVKIYTYMEMGKELD